MKDAGRSKKPLKGHYAKMASEKSAGQLERARAIGYSDEDLAGVPEEARLVLGCGNPAALAGLAPGETVLDLGSGGGLDAFIAARRVGKRGKVIGVDATPEMVARASAAARKRGFENVEFLVGTMEKLPVADASVDVIISNCVISHSRDKAATFREARRALVPGGRMLIADLVTRGEIPKTLGRGGEVWAEWLKLAATRDDYLAAMKQAEFAEVVILAEREYGAPGVPLPEGLAGKIVSLQVRLRK
jgi:SAM-dependent methyltransferase